MAYFENFSPTLYSLDNRRTVQVITDITKRSIIDSKIINNLSLFYNYDVIDGETPEIVADKFYDDPELHWLILHTNQILNPYFVWPISQNNLINNVLKKYNDKDAHKHYVDSNSEIVVGNVYLESELTEFSVNDVVSNNTNFGIGIIVSKISNSNVIVNISYGGIKANDEIKLYNNSNVTANITSTTSIGCTPVTVYQYEDELNESRRRIKILKENYVRSVVNEFKAKMER